MSIEGIALEHFSELPQTEIKVSTKECPRHAVFHYYLSDDIKQDSSTTTAHRKRLIELLKKKKVLTSTLITMWENIDGCEDQYRCASAIYLTSVMSQHYSIIIDCGMIAPGHGKELVDGINAIDKIYIYQLISNVQITVLKNID